MNSSLDNMLETLSINVLGVSLLQIVLIVLTLLLSAFLYSRWSRTVLTEERDAFHSNATTAERERDRENLKLYQKTEAELNDQLAQGAISGEDLQRLLAEAQDELLGSVQQNYFVREQAGSNSLSRLGLLVLLMFAMLSAWLIYQPIGLSLGANDQVEVAKQIRRLREANDQESWISAANQAGQTLDKHLRREASSDEYQQMLGLRAQLNSGLGNHGMALNDYRNLLDKNPDDVFLQINAVESEYFLRSSQNQRPFFTDDMRKELDKILKVETDMPVALSLRGTSAFEREQYSDALADWQRAVSLLPPQSPSATQLHQGILIAQSRLGIKPSLDASETGSQDDVQQEAQAYVDVKVDIDRNQLSKQDSPSTAVFIFARPVDGPPMPVAAKRLTLADLPTQIRLSEHDRMTALSIMEFDQVSVAARLSRSGSPVGAEGDLESETLVVTVAKAQQNENTSSTVIELLINQVR